MTGPDSLLWWRRGKFLSLVGLLSSLVACSDPDDGVADGVEPFDTAPLGGGRETNSGGEQATGAEGNQSPRDDGSDVANSTGAAGGGGQMMEAGVRPSADSSGGELSETGEEEQGPDQNLDAQVPSLQSVLVFTRTAGYPHDSIPAGIQAIFTLGNDNGFSVQQTDSPADFNDGNLVGFDVVVFLNTTEDVLDEAGQAAFERYIQGGGGWVGVHAAADTEYDWPWFGGLLGGNAWFEAHPQIQQATLLVEEPGHASTEHLTNPFQLTDEWYNFRQNPRASVSVLLTLDESSYDVGAGAMGTDHPIAWYHEYDGGRAWYTGLGHRIELYSDPLFTQHLLGGIEWASGTIP